MDVSVHPITFFAQLLISSYSQNIRLSKEVNLSLNPRYLHYYCHAIPKIAISSKVFLDFWWKLPTKINVMTFPIRRFIRKITLSLNLQYFQHIRHPSIHHTINQSINHSNDSYTFPFRLNNNSLCAWLLVPLLLLPQLTLCQRNIINVYIK